MPASTVFADPTLPALARFYAADPGAVTAVAAAALERAAAADPAIWIARSPAEAVLAEAGRLARLDPAARGALPLFGVPVAIKDNIDVAGLETTAACPAFAYRPDQDAPAVARLRAAGALIMGKTNLDQFATGLVGTRSPYGVPRNALDPALVPGGSSSGSAVAAALGLVSLALGTDTAGSGRVPAALNNIVGLKPTRGLVSTRGVVPACRSLDCVSVFALTVADALAALEVIAGFDPADPGSRPLPAESPEFPAEGARIGVPRAPERVFAGDAAAEAAYAGALKRLEGLGARLVPLDWAPFAETAALLYQSAFVAERLEATGEMLARAPEALFPVTRTILAGASGHSALDAFRAQHRLAALRRRLAPVLATVDLLAVPSMPRAIRRDEDAADPLGFNALSGTYTNFVNFLDLAALAVPQALTPTGPAGVTLIGPAFSDRALARLGARLHAAAGLPLGALEAPTPPAPEWPPGPAEAVDLLAVGAHMEGLALNHELTGLGAVKRAEVATAPSYRLYALAGAPPRPGMVRVREGGAAIAGELWRLSPAALGRFMTTIPSPLGIGTVTLADGRAVKGFLCEAAATEGAEDITALGGWRAWLARR